MTSRKFQVSIVRPILSKETVTYAADDSQEEETEEEPEMRGEDANQEE